jgi:hypothetical protein
MLCFGIDGTKRYLERGRAMLAEIEEIRGTRRMD